MTLKQILTFDVNRVLQSQVKRILFCDVGHALTRPIRNPGLKAVCGWIVGTMILGLASMLSGKVPSDTVATLLVAAFALGAAASHLPSSYKSGGHSTTT
ncbi:MAG: hypothetical protein M3468_03890 [Acidobacteriota bacterium]|nr:hypothetical protein [Acidobacteriota bacterium]